MDDSPTGLINALQALLGGAITTLFAATAGRLMYHSGEVKAKRRRFFGPELIWELPIVVGMGIIGEAVSSWFGLNASMAAGLIAALGYWGPRGAQAMAEKFLPVQDSKK